MADDLRAQLEPLLAEWQAAQRQADDIARRERVGDQRAAYFYQGASQTYGEVIAAVTRVLYGDAAPIVTPAPVAYLPVEAEAVSAMLIAAGLFPRRLSRHNDHAFTAIFPRVSAQSQEGRLATFAAIPYDGGRLTLLDTGKLPDTGEPYVDFAFVRTGE